MLDAAAKTDFPIPTGVFAQTVTEVQHYTDSLFRFRMTRPDTFRFRSGEFVMIGLPNAEKPVFRAYSVASPSWDEELEFYSIKVSWRAAHRASAKDQRGRHRPDAQEADGDLGQ
jgi:ferredoxin--NADP+ reductase